MNNKEKTFIKKFKKLVLKRVNVYRKARKLFVKNNQQHKKYIDKTLILFNPLLSKVDKYKNISYKLKKGHIFSFYYSSNKENPELILEITIRSLLSPTSLSMVKEPYIDIDYKNNTKDNKNKLEPLSFVGEISKYLLKNELKIVSKITSYTNNYFKWKQPIDVKIKKLTEEYKTYEIILKNLHLPYFIKYLKEGFILNPTSPYTDARYKFFTGSTYGWIKNITKIQLLNDKEIKFIYLDDSNNLQTFSLFPEGNIQSYIKKYFLGEGLLPYIDSPKIYVKIVRSLFEEIESTKE